MGHVIKAMHAWWQGLCEKSLCFPLTIATKLNLLFVLKNVFCPYSIEVTHIPRVIHCLLFSPAWEVYNFCQYEYQNDYYCVRFIFKNIHNIYALELLEETSFLKPIKHHNNRIEMFSFNLNKPVVQLAGESFK